MLCSGNLCSPCDHPERERIVACVNACSGITDPETTVPEMVRFARDWLAWYGADGVEVADAFRLETGFYAPGRDIHPAVNPTDEMADQRRRRDEWNKFLDRRIGSLVERARVLLAKVDEDA